AITRYARNSARRNAVIPEVATCFASAPAPKAPPEPRVTFASSRPRRVSSSVSLFWNARAGGAPFARLMDSVAVYRRLYRITLEGDWRRTRLPSWPTWRRALWAAE